MDCERKVKSAPVRLHFSFVEPFLKLLNSLPGNDHFRIIFTPTGTPIANSSDDTRWGGTVGAGLEFGFAPNWSAGVEYNHLFMQDRTHTFVDTTGAFFGTDRIRQDVDLVTVRVNYRWGGPVIAKY